MRACWISLSSNCMLLLLHSGNDMLIMARFRSREYDSEDGPLDPISGATSALLGTIGSLMMGVADFPIEIFRAIQSKPSGDEKSADDRKTLGGSGTPEGIVALASGGYSRDTNMCNPSQP